MSELMSQNVLRHPGKAFELNVNALENPMVAVPDVKQFHYTGKGLNYANVQRLFSLTEWSQKRQYYSHQPLWLLHLWSWKVDYKRKYFLQTVLIPQVKTLWKWSPISKTKFLNEKKL